MCIYGTNTYFVFAPTAWNYVKHWLMEVNMLFSIKKEKHNIYQFFPVVLIAVIILGLVIFSNITQTNNMNKSREFLERALNRSISQCYALEGMYPPSLNYLIDNYGLTFDSEDYFIDYQYIGSNLRPDVTIIERK